MSLTFYAPAPRPENERARQQAVDDSGVLQAPPDPELHAVVVAAAKAFATPIAAISIIDCDRQWFAARVGLHLPETARATSLCAHAILDPGGMLVVEDTAADERFAGNPVVTDEPLLGFYAGVPILYGDGQAIGTLCVCDHRPRTFDVEARSRLVALAERASVAIARLRLDGA